MRLTEKQIQEIKQINVWSETDFHGNRKKVGSIPVELFRQIVQLKRLRAVRKAEVKPSKFEDLRSLIASAKRNKGTNYYKELIEGNTGIYYAHPFYQHADYNKCRIMDKTAENIRLMQLVNSLIRK